MKITRLIIASFAALLLAGAAVRAGDAPAVAPGPQVVAVGPGVVAKVRVPEGWRVNPLKNGTLIIESTADAQGRRFQASLEFATGATKEFATMKDVYAVVRSEVTTSASHDARADVEGSMMKSANGFGAYGVYITDRPTAPLHDYVTKAHGRFVIGDVAVDFWTEAIGSGQDVNFRELLRVIQEGITVEAAK